MRIRHAASAFVGALLLTTFACTLSGGLPPATEGPPTGAPATATAAPAASATVATTTAPPGPTVTPTAAGPREAIFLRAPGPGSEVVSPLQVHGMAAPTFEQNLGLRLIDFDGATLAEGSVIIDAPLGERGPFSGQLEFTVSAQQPAALQVFATSARDGGITHLDAAIVTLLTSGPANVTQAEAGPEQIQIETPAAGATVSGGTVTVRGFGLASFEQTLVAEVLDGTGAVVGQAPITVAAPELGQPGPFEVEVSYSVGSSGPGRIVVRDPSPAYGGPVHLNSVEIELQP